MFSAFRMLRYYNRVTDALVISNTLLHHAQTFLCFLFNTIRKYSFTFFSTFFFIFTFFIYCEERESNPLTPSGIGFSSTYTPTLPIAHFRNAILRHNPYIIFNFLYLLQVSVCQIPVVSPIIFVLLPGHLFMFNIGFISSIKIRSRNLA